MTSFPNSFRKTSILWKVKSVPGTHPTVFSMALKEVSVALSPETSVAGRNKFLDGLVRRVTQARYYTCCSTFAKIRGAFSATD